MNRDAVGIRGVGGVLGREGETMGQWDRGRARKQPSWSRGDALRPESAGPARGDQDV